MFKALESIWAIVVFLFFGWVAYSAIPGPSFLSSTISAYSLYCDGELTELTNCTGRWKPSAEHKYFVSADTQIVVEQSGSLPPERLLNCVVLDRQNWHCKGEHALTTMLDGRFNVWSQTMQTTTMLVNPVIKPVWFFYRLKNGQF
jgi:hypothetical protein